EMLGDIDSLLTRCEAFAKIVDVLQTQMASNATTLDAAGERYRIAACTFSEQAKLEVSSYLERKAGEAGTKILNSQQAAMREEVRRTLEATANDAATKARPVWSRLAELVGVGIVAGTTAAGMVYWLMR
ncbi:MAG: hypothetical protein WKG03_17425, partial [Telluria sp.]